MTEPHEQSQNKTVFFFFFLKETPCGLNDPKVITVILLYRHIHGCLCIKTNYLFAIKTKEACQKRTYQQKNKLHLRLCKMFRKKKEHQDVITVRTFDIIPILVGYLYNKW